MVLSCDGRAGNHSYVQHLQFVVLIFQDTICSTQCFLNALCNSALIYHNVLKLNFHKCVHLQNLGLLP